MITTYGPLTVHAQDKGAYYFIDARDIHINGRGAHIRIGATWNYGEDVIDICVDVDAEELTAGEFRLLMDAMGDAKSVVDYIEENWRAMIDAHLEAENAAA